ncbi:MAG TPA: NAD(P)H-quinone oxidoreductase [Gemmatimonadales bacterium]|nr:NAD(P)H-quinone oxidoreductase [Gemmatimonadales bacterium]
MRAVIYTGAGGPEVIGIGEVPKPEVRPKHIRVRVHAAGLNRADLIQRRGQYAAPPGWPADIPGLEYAGEVEAVRGGTRWKVGDRVMGLVGGGAQAELLAVHEDEALPIPEGLSFAEAAAIPEAFLTAYDALVTRGRLAAGERVLIHAVGSGVGTAAAQIARHLGATVLGTSRSADKLARALVYGLDVGIDTSRGGFAEAVGEPVDVILDVLGGPAFAENLGVLAPRGRLVMLGFLAGSRATADLGPILRKRLEVIGTVMRTRTLEERAPLVREFAERMLPLFDHRIEHSAPLRPVLERVYPMAELAGAHRLMEGNETFGKVVVTWDAPVGQGTGGAAARS